ncbi:OmpA family protein [Pseudoroseicyclus aestuarii]|uniref:OOP family OmpA-OmpF porin n=1 Tax=Pseudoroseicyclus aestuarii TaxID=1795041 RepID=A0A318T3G1_9RHOB|nr:OmpA family protein [Pseudoroseicyclus aestuarii]PYE84744.1 OOP family OmpA-OmpF porin [Pseudoroseicyclus aestuarii]
MRRLIPLFAFVLAAALCAVSARVAVAVVEGASTRSVREALAEFDWTRVQADGLQVVIEGEAPSEADRFRAISAAGGVVEASRVIDAMSVAAAEPIEVPDFAVEILRNDSGVSLIGLVPASTDREAMTRAIGRIAGGATVTDLLDEADYPLPEDWNAALRFAIETLETLPRAKISVGAGHVAIETIADSPEEQRELITTLEAEAPEEVELDLSVSAPRPVITPFTLRFVMEEDGTAHFDACSADTEEARARIVEAAIEAGVPGPATCRLGLGVPSTRWGEAVARGIAAVQALGGGTLTFSDADVSLVAPMGTAPALFDEVVGDLTGDLPDLFALEAELPETPEPQPEGPPQFTATLPEEGPLRLRGRMPDAQAKQTAAQLARAEFGAEISDGTRLAQDLPGDWSLRVLTGLSALAELSNGTLTVTPEGIDLRGQTGNADASDEIAVMVADRLGPAAELALDVTYVEALDPIAGLPSPQECVQQIRFVSQAQKITFDPGSASITAGTRPVVDQIAEILQRCPNIELEVAGYTDSQGSEGGNQRLSQRRADAVLDTLRQARVPVAAFEAVGYGEADPIADNATEEGREANRRIEFNLIGASAEAAEAESEAEDAAPGDAEAEAEDSETAEGEADTAQDAAEAPGLPRARPDDLDVSGE